MDSTAISVGFSRVRAAGFIGAGLRLSDVDLPRIGHAIGVGEDEIHAIIDVEAAGSGFDKFKRPKMLFEPHKFYAHLSGTKRAQAVTQGIAYPTWRKDYPADSYPRLAMALAIDETAALKSASWGLGQILGENFVAAGYGSPQHMVLSFTEMGEAEHLGAMIRFIVTNKLDDEVRAHNWSAFARGYNGPQYAANAYHTKLAAAYLRWSKIKDTPWSPVEDAVGKPLPTPAVTLEPVPELTAGAAVPSVPGGERIPPATVPVPPAPDTRSVWERMADRLRAAFPLNSKA